VPRRADKLATNTTGDGPGRVLIALFVISWCAVLCSAWAAAWARHQAREQFRELQALHRERDELDIEWTQLRLELGTLAMHDRVEAAARKQLAMRAPLPDEMVTVVVRDD
jgi:cell division protein FtsL